MVNTVLAHSITLVWYNASVDLIIDMHRILCGWFRFSVFHPETFNYLFQIQYVKARDFDSEQLDGMCVN